MGRVLFVLDLPLERFLRAVILPGLGPYIAAGLLAWPVARLVAQTNRWQGAGVIAAVGMVYAAAVTATLHYWILTEEEKQKGIKLLRQVLGGFRSQGATA
jgi:hypothetical protein